MDVGMEDALPSRLTTVHADVEAGDGLVSIGKSVLQNPD